MDTVCGKMLVSDIILKRHINLEQNKNANYEDSKDIDEKKNKHIKLDGVGPVDNRPSTD